jgi:hypothetical protein
MVRLSKTKEGRKKSLFEIKLKWQIEIKKMIMIKYGDVYSVSLDPAIGTEIQKTRPCVVISVDSLNK